MHGELEFFHVRKEHSHILREKWSEYERSQDSANSGSGTANAVAGTNTEGGDLTPQPKGKAKAKGTKAAKRQEADGAEQTPEAKKKKDTKQLAQHVQKLKGFYHATTSAAMSLISTISVAKDEDKWAWANNDQNLGKLQKLRDTLTAKLSDDSHAILISELPVLKKTIGEAKLTVQMESFLKIEDDVNKLASAHQQLLNMAKNASSSA